MRQRKHPSEDATGIVAARKSLAFVLEKLGNIQINADKFVHSYPGLDADKLKATYEMDIVNTIVSTIDGSVDEGSAWDSVYGSVLYARNQLRTFCKKKLIGLTYELAWDVALTQVKDVLDSMRSRYREHSTFEGDYLKQSKAAAEISRTLISLLFNLDASLSAYLRSRSEANKALEDLQKALEANRKSSNEHCFVLALPEEEEERIRSIFSKLMLAEPAK
jgi:hypothetical protein